MKTSKKQILSALRATALSATFLTATFPPPLMAQEKPETERAQVIKYSDGNYIAYVKSPVPAVNAATERGLQALQGALTDSTSLDPEEEIVGLNLDDDTLIPFKFIYWPITDQDETLSPEAQRKVQNYIDKGRMIMFDVVRTNSPDIRAALQNVLGDVNLGPLTTLPESQGLTRTFFVTDGLRGSFNIGPVDIQQEQTNETESVTSIILAQRNWPRAWSGTSFAEGSEDYKAALQAGINAVTYAYIGRYRDDQYDMGDVLDRVSRQP